MLKVNVKKRRFPTEIEFHYVNCSYLNMSYICLLVGIMGSTRSFDFTSEHLRLIHSFDKEGGMWIRCLQCYNYVFTTKKGNNVAKACSSCSDSD